MSTELEIALIALIVLWCLGGAFVIVKAIFAPSDEEKLQRLAEEEAGEIEALIRVDIWEGIDIARANYKIPPPKVPLP